MRDNDFTPKIEILQQRLSELQRCATENPAQLASTLPETFGELLNVLAELRESEEKYCILSDITERVRAEEALRRRNTELEALYRTSLEINAQRDLSTLLRTIVERAAELLDARMGGLYLIRPDGETLELVVSHNMPRDYTGTTLRLGEGLSGRIAQTGEAMTIDDYQHWEGRAPVYAHDPFRRVVGVPLKVRDRVIGVINVTDDQQTGLFTDDEVRLVGLFADQAAIAVENARLYDAVQHELAERARAEEALRESEDRYRRITEAVTDYIYTVRVEGGQAVETTHGPACVAVTGYTSEEFAANPLLWLGMVDERDRAVVLEQAQRVLTGEAIEPLEHRIIRKDGAQRWVRNTPVPHWDPQGKLLSYDGLIRDITERVRAEEAEKQRTEQTIRHQAALLDLSKIDHSDLLSALNRTLEVDAQTLGVERVSYWSLTEDHSAILCGNLYRYSTNVHEGELRLEAAQYPEYFRLLRQNRAIVADDARTDPATREYTDGYYIPLGITSILDVPVRRQGELIGIVCHEHVGPRRHWTVEEQDFAASIADMVALALETSERKRTEEALQKRNTELEALYKTSLEINAQPDLSTLLHTIVERAVELLGARMGGLYLMRPDGQTLELVVSYNLPGDYAGVTLRLGEGLSGRIAQTGEPMMIEDYRQWEGRALIYADGPFRRVLGVPLKVGGKVIGVINITDNKQTGPFSGDEVRLVSLFADQAAIAVENARLYEASQRELAERVRAEQALKESEEKFRTLADQSPNMIFINVRGRVVYGNKRSEEVMGYTIEEFCSEDFNFLDLIAPEHRGLIKAKFGRHMQGEDVEPYEYALVTKDGKRVEAIIAAKLIDYGGESAIFGVVTDITERKRVEEALRESEARYRRLFEDAVVGIFQSTPEGKAIAVNPAFARMFGYESPEDVIATVKNVATDLFADPQRRSEIMRLMAERPDLRTFENLYRRKDGSTFTGNLHVWPVRNADGHLLHLEGFIEDITARVRAEEEIRWRAETLAALHQTALDLATQRALPDLLRAIMVRAVDLLKAKEGTFFLYRPASDDLERVLAYHHEPDSIGAVLRRGEGVAGRALECGQAVTVTDYNRWEGRLKQYEASFAAVAVPILWGDRPLGVLFVADDPPRTFSRADIGLLERFTPLAAAALENNRLVRDLEQQMDKLRETQAQLVQTAKLAAVGELAAGVAHELNNPLTSVLGFAEWLLRSLAPDAPERHDLETIAREARRARDIVRNLLDFARQTKPLREPSDVNQALQQTLALIRQHLEKSGVVITEEYAPEIGLVSLDGGRMKQVFLNLITNAAQAMPGGGTLLVRTVRVGDEVAVSIADGGAGIPPEVQERIFDPFFSTKPSGTGLGLSVSLGIVEEHGGRITVESQVGQGSTFTVWLPGEVKDGR